MHDGRERDDLVLVLLHVEDGLDLEREHGEGRQAARRVLLGLGDGDAALASGLALEGRPGNLEGHQMVRGVKERKGRALLLWGLTLEMRSQHGPMILRWMMRFSMAVALAPKTCA